MTPRRYNPWMQFHGGFVPNWLLMREEVSANAKLVFARLCQYAGKDGECYPAQGTIAKEVGLAKRTLQRALEELAAHGLITFMRAGMGKANSYAFLTHPWMQGAKGPRQNGAIIDAVDGATVTTPEAQLDMPQVAYKESQGKESEEEEEVEVVVKMWNELHEIAPSIPKVLSLSEARKKKLAARLKSPTWAGIWRAAVTAIAGSSFLTGSNQRRWVADFDWFIRSDDAAVQIIEGKYADRDQRGHVKVPIPGAEKRPQLTGWEADVAEALEDIQAGRASALCDADCKWWRRTYEDAKRGVGEAKVNAFIAERTTEETRTIIAAMTHK